MCSEYARWKLKRKSRELDRPLTSEERIALLSALGVDDPSTFCDECQVYFMQIDNLDGFIKIGCGTNPTARRKRLQTALPYHLKLLKHVPGGLNEERILHERLKEWRIRGEWFWPSKQVMRTIDRVEKILRIDP